MKNFIIVTLSQKNVKKDFIHQEVQQNAQVSS